MTGKISAAVYFVALPLAIVAPSLSIAIYVGVAIAWLVPDRRIGNIVEDLPADAG